METLQENQLQSSELENNKRPQFLNILCILSFIWCGLVLLGTLYGMYQMQPEVMQNQIDALRTVNPEMAEQMEDQMIEFQENVYMQISQYLGFLYLLLSFLGILMMYKLKKKGFYFYLAGELLPYTGLLFTGKGMSLSLKMGGESMNTIAIIVMVMSLVIDFGFMIMYGLNLKHMKNN